MNYLSQSTQQKFPFPYDRVFRGLIRVISNAGMEIENQDMVIGRISVSTAMSLLSWGENLVIVVEKLDESSTVVKIDSSLSIAGNLAGAHRHQKNFETIIQGLSKLLRRKSELVENYCGQ